MYNMTETKFPCATCNKEVQIRDHAIQCELRTYVSLGNILTVLERLIEFLKACMLLCEMQCNALWAACSVCWEKGPPMQKLQELETRIQLMAHQQQMDKLLMNEMERLLEHLLLED